MIILYLFKIIYIIFYISFINSYENLKIDINDNINYYNNNKFRCRLAALAGSNGPWDKGPFGGGKSPMHEMAITAAKRHKPLFPCTCISQLHFSIVLAPESSVWPRHPSRPSFQPLGTPQNHHPP